MEVRKCKMCHETKGIMEFHTYKKKGKILHRYTCKVCVNEEKRAKYRLSKETGKRVTKTDRTTGMRECRKCHEVKPVSEYSIRRVKGREYLHSYCKPCAREVVLASKKKYKNPVKEIDPKWLTRGLNKNNMSTGISHIGQLAGVSF